MSISNFNFSDRNLEPIWNARALTIVLFKAAERSIHIRSDYGNAEIWVLRSMVLIPPENWTLTLSNHNNNNWIRGFGSGIRHSRAAATSKSKPLFSDLSINNHYGTIDIEWNVISNSTVNTHTHTHTHTNIHFSFVSVFARPWPWPNIYVYVRISNTRICIHSFVPRVCFSAFSFIIIFW